MSGHIILSHGSNSSPLATKVSALAAVAEKLGYTTERPDFSAMDKAGHVASVAPRIDKLTRCIEASPSAPILVGSSMGAFTSGLASLRARCKALFLLALPMEIDDYGERFDMDQTVPSMLIHGFDDDICPLSDALEFAHASAMPSLVVADGHRLAEHVDIINAQFSLFLKRLDS